MCIRWHRSFFFWYPISRSRHQLNYASVLPNYRMDEELLFAIEFVLKVMCQKHTSVPDQDKVLYTLSPPDARGNLLMRSIANAKTPTSVDHAHIYEGSCDCRFKFTSNSKWMLVDVMYIPMRHSSHEILFCTPLYIYMYNRQLSNCFTHTTCANTTLKNIDCSQIQHIGRHAWQSPSCLSQRAYQAIAI